MMKNRAGLFLATLMTCAVIAAACVKQPSNSTQSGSPTPTPSGTATGTPTPTPLPFKINPVLAWTSNLGAELWIRFEAGFDGTVRNIATSAPNCTTQTLNVGITTSAFQVHTVRLEGPALTACLSGVNHTFDFDLGDADGGCTTGCVTDSEQHIVLVGANFPPGPTVFTNVSASRSATTNAVRFDATNAPGGPIVDLTEERLYKLNGALIQSCTTAVAIGPSSEPAVIDTCSPVPSVMTNGVANYTVFFRGTIDGAEFEQFVTFPFTP